MSNLIANHNLALKSDCWIGMLGIDNVPTCSFFRPVKQEIGVVFKALITPAGVIPTLVFLQVNHSQMPTIEFFIFRFLYFLCGMRILTFPCDSLFICFTGQGNGCVFLTNFNWIKTNNSENRIDARTVDVCVYICGG